MKNILKAAGLVAGGLIVFVDGPLAVQVAGCYLQWRKEHV